MDRARIVTVARSWLRTPYHHMARAKGIGADCLTLLAEVYAEAGLVEPIEIPYYPRDWMQHRDAERYLQGLQRYMREIEGPPQPGDVALWKFGRCYSHGAIVIHWPIVIHAYVGRGCVEENAEAAQWLEWVGDARRPRKFFSLWG